MLNVLNELNSICCVGLVSLFDSLDFTHDNCLRNVMVVTEKEINVLVRTLCLNVSNQLKNKQRQF